MYKKGLSSLPIQVRAPPRDELIPLNTALFEVPCGCTKELSAGDGLKAQLFLKEHHTQAWQI